MIITFNHFELCIHIQLSENDRSTISWNTRKLKNSGYLRYTGFTSIWLLRIHIISSQVSCPHWWMPASHIILAWLPPDGGADKGKEKWGEREIRWDEEWGEKEAQTAIYIDELSVKNGVALSLTWEWQVRTQSIIADQSWRSKSESHLSHQVGRWKIKGG